MSGDSRQGVWDVFAKAMELYDKKNADYGDAWQRDGWRGNLPRLLQKAERVRNLLWRSDPRTPAVGDEQAVDTLLDMLNSIAFTIINLVEEREWGNEVPRTQRAAAAEQAYTPGEATTFYDQVSAELPHHDPVSLGTHTDPPTTRITVDPRAVQENEELSLLAPNGDPDPYRQEPQLPLGPDEVRRSEAENTGRTRRGQRKPVADSPQA